MLRGATSITLEMVESAAVSSNEEYFVLENKYVHQLLCSAGLSKIGFRPATFARPMRASMRWLLGKLNSTERQKIR